MDFNPKDGAGVIAEGEYDAVIETAKEGMSKKGKKMLTLKIRVFAEREAVINDYIVVPEGLFKLKKLCKAIDRIADFESGTIEVPSLQGASFKAVVAIEQDDSGQYDDKNVITGYKALETAAPKAAPATDQNIPF